MTAYDVIQAGACEGAVAQWCRSRNFYMGFTSAAIELAAEKDKPYIEIAAGMAGYGDGDGYGDGYGYGYGDGDGYGDGYGSGYGSGYGDGYGDGDGYGYGDGDGNGDGYGL